MRNLPRFCDYLASDKFVAAPFFSPRCKISMHPLSENADGTQPLVTLTGCTGFIGSHVARLFLEDGGYRVRGAVRDATNQSKLEPLKQALGAELFAKMEFATVNLQDEASMTQAIAGSTYVVHMASPIDMSLTTEEEFIRPAVDGTLCALKACKANGVRRLVITSSTATVETPAEGSQPANGILDESVWSEVKAETEGMFQMYAKSKIMAEKAAWEFQASLPASEKFEVVTILPSATLGPNLKKEENASGMWLRMLMTGQLPQVGPGGWVCCDVREVAFAHLQAIKVPAAANRRFLVSTKACSFSECARPVIDKYAPQGWPVCQNFAEEDGGW